MLHLNVVRADPACAAHAHDSSAHMAQHQTASTSHGMSMHAEHAVGATKSCDAPVQPDCCQALVTCSVALGLSTDTSPVSVLSSHDAVFGNAQTAPESRTGAPEPPPPRA